MVAAAASRALLGRALLASLAVHVLVALFIPALAWMPSRSSVETITFERIARIEIQPHEQPRPQPRALAPHRSSKPVIAVARRVELAHTSAHQAASPPPAATNKILSAPVVATSQQAGEGTSLNTASPQASAAPVARAVVATVGRDVGGNMPFGAEQPEPILDPGIRKQLDSLGVHVTLVVTVGEDGHTKNVVFQPPVDPQLETRIQSLLADASWDPAVCGGGISCEGRATIRL
jgi:hypothetical protein